MATYFIIIAIPLGILLILLDIALYSYRKRIYFSGSGNPYIHYLMEWFRNILTKLSKLSFIKWIQKSLLIKNSSFGSDNIASIKNIAPIMNHSDNSINPDSANGSSVSFNQITTPKADTNSDRNKLVHIQISADIPEGAEVIINLKVEDGQGNATIQQITSATDLKQGQISNPQMDWDKRKTTIRNKFIDLTNRWNLNGSNLDKYLLLASVLIYALVVGIGIDRYPIYFFTDEAIHMNLASNFLRDGFTNYFGEFLPTFFTTEGWVNGTSVYVQLLPLIIFGKSVIITRLVSAFISLLGALAVGLLLKDAFKLKYYWAGIFMVLTTPAWFLHARTAFEYVEVGSFYSIFLYFYSRYRNGHMRSFYWALIAGALAFYTHGLGQILMGVSGLALLIVDFRYHLHPDRRKTILNGLLLGAILLLPFARYYLAHPGEAAAQVKRRGSYWVDDNLTLLQKIAEFFKQYFYGLNPSYWYFKNPVDIIRHTMDGYGNGLLYTLPFFAIGLFQSIKNIHLPSYRFVLISLLICPIPASVVAIGMPRMLWMTIPIALILVIGLSAVLQWVESRWHIRSISVAFLLFIIMAGVSIYMLRDALVNGPTWFEDYSLYGLQYGASQVFQDVARVGLEQDPNRRYVISPSWANGTEQFIDFFIPKSDQKRVSLGQPINFISEIRKEGSNYYFITTSDEYDKLIANPEFKDISVHQVLPFPNGKPGFYVLTLNVSDNIDAILAAEHEKNRTPVEDIITIAGQSTRVIHSPIGSGSLEDIFDNNPDTLARVLEANPFIFDLYPTTPINTQGIIIQTGSLEKFTVTVSLYAPGSNTPVTYTQTFTNLPPDPLVTMAFDNGPATAARIYIEIKDDLSGETSQIHVRTIQIK